MKSVLIFFLIFMVGCSNSTPIKKLKKREIKMVVIDIEQKISNHLNNTNIGYAIAQNFKSRLLKDGIKIVERPKRATFTEERKLSKKGFGVEYILSGTIENIDTKQIVYPPRQRSEGGSSAGWTEYRACISGSIKLFKPPFREVLQSFLFNNICIRQNHENYQEMFLRTAPKVVDEVVLELEEFLVKVNI